MTEIGKFHHKCEILEIKDGGRRRLGITNMLITSVRIELRGCNLNCIYLDITEIGNFCQSVQLLAIQDGGAAILDLPKC
jgi:hypothetical protein